MANNRVHALLRLLHDDVPRAAAALDADCAKHVNRTRQPAVVSVRTLAVATPEVEVPQAFAHVTGSACLNNRVYSLMNARGYRTIVLNYEVPGHFVVDKWKTEIMHLSRTLYDRKHKLCAPQPPTGSKCYHCGNKTPATTLMCERHEKELYYERRYYELRNPPASKF